MNLLLCEERLKSGGSVLADKLFETTASKFSKVVICIRSFLQILYHSITTKVVAINIQALEE